jgi:adenylate cyclase class IV
MELAVVLAEHETDSDGERIASVLMEQLGVLQEDVIEQAYVELLGDQRSSLCASL